MIRPNAHPAAVGIPVVDSVGNGLPELLVLKVMNTDFLRLSPGLIFTSFVGKVAYQFLFLRIHRDHGPLLFLKSFGLLVNMAELSIPVRMGGALFGLLSRWQAVSQDPSAVAPLSCD